MTALAGIVRFDGGPADALSVTNMIDCVAHRGSDWRQVWSQGSVAFGYRWRRVGGAQPIDTQPIVDSCTGVALVFDGRLDNREELGEKFLIDDLARLSDADLVLAGYARQGGDSVASLVGDFAFALWDPRAQRLLMARDALGMRPISYVTAPGFVAFATEPRQLIRLRAVERRPNLGFFAEWLAGRMSHPSETIFRGIERVRPAHTVTVTSSGLRSTRYWDIDSQRSIRYADDREYVEHFRQLYAQSMQARLRGLDRVGVLLSGGLDSSSVVGMAARLNPGGRPVAVQTYTLAFDGLPDGDDRQSAETVARFCDVPFFCLPAQGTASRFYIELARALEDTIPSPIGSGRLVLARRAFSEGCGVLLDGTGGDEWFGGAHQHTADLLRGGRLIAAVRQLRADADSDLGHGIGTLTASSVWPLLPNAMRDGIKRLLPPRDRVPRGFNRVFARQVALVDRITTPLTDRRFASIATGTAYMTATHPYCSYAWEEIARQDAIAGGELGAPLMDRRLAEFAMALPEEQRWAGSSTKRVLRDAMDGWLPDSTRRRYKADAGSAQVCELRRLYADGAFKAMELVEDGVLDGTTVDAMYEEMIEEAANGDRGYKMLADQLWTIFLGECTWQALFGRRATPLASSSEFGGELLSD